MIVKSGFFKRDFDVSKAQLIGQGNFAQVFRVFDADSQNYLAIRRVDRSLGESDDIQKQKTINEQLRRVQNQHILKIYDIIESETCIWYITQYCEGGSLWDALNTCQDNRMNEKDALECIHQISKGVKQLHNHRITHRDLKPENILLKTKYIANKPIPVIKIADFGLSTKKIIMETIAGTKEYIAPEQARFHNYTNAVDVWSLGIIFDEILHGSPFYVGDNNKEVFQKILKNPYKVRDESIRPSIQEFLVSVLKKKAYERPIIAVICQNIEKILDEIKTQRGQKIQERPLSSFQKKNIKSMTHIVEPRSEVKAVQTRPERPNSRAQQPKGEVKVQVKAQQKVQFSPPPVLSANQSLNQSTVHSLSVNPSLQELKQMQTSNRLNDLNSLSSTKRQQRKIQQRKAKTPFKRQNGRPELFKSTEQIDHDASMDATHRAHKFLHASVRKQPEFIKGFNRDKSRQHPQTSTVDMQKINASLQAEKVSVYRVEKKKLQIVQTKVQELTPNIVDIKEYMETVIKMRTELQQSSLSIAKDREFIPNAQLTVAQFPNKFEGEEVLKNFRRSYDFLNYFNTSPDYEIKLHIGRDNLESLKSKAQLEILAHKQKIKASFFGQLNRFVDTYISKTIK